MSDFRFLHAADIHLDSPLHGLSRYEGLPDRDIRGASRAAFDNLIEHAIDEAVSFVVIAGDLFDGDWKDMSTGLYFARAMGRLDQAGIPVFLLAGNHDAASVITRTVPWPSNVRQFDTRRPQTHLLPDLRVAVSGQSFATSAVTENLVAAYPEAVADHFNIGVLHSALAGRKNHKSYAPCSLDDLRSKRYDYWALGHVHQYEEVSRDPYVVFPGNTQGRTIRETGPKGAVIVTVEDLQITGLERIEVDVLRWTALEIDCSSKSAGDLPDLMRAALTAEWHSKTASLPLVARLTLIGGTPDAGAIVERAAALRDEARAVAASISPDLFIEKVKVQVEPEASSAPAAIGDDLAVLIEEASRSPGLVEALAEDLGPFLVSAQSLLGQADESGFRRSAAEGEWPAILQNASLALRSRLTGG